MQAAADTSDLLADSATRRQTMVDCQVRTFDVTDQRVIARFLAVPRERCLPAAVRDLAYSDVGLVTPAGRYLLPPLVLARMIQNAQVRSTDRVLDVAAGSGYGSAILAGLAASVTALEADAALQAELRAGLAAAGVTGVLAEQGALEQGVAAGAPYDVIMVNGAIETNLDGLFAQLADGGRLVAIRRAVLDPTGRAAKVMCWEKRHGEVGTRYLFDASAPVAAAFRTAPAFVF